MTGTQHILILHVCSTEDSKSKEFLLDGNLSHVYSIDEGKPESVIVNKSSTVGRKSELFHKSINKEKYVKNET